MQRDNQVACMMAWHQTNSTLSKLLNGHQVIERSGSTRGGPKRFSVFGAVVTMKLQNKDYHYTMPQSYMWKDQYTTWVCSFWQGKFTEVSFLGRKPPIQNNTCWLAHDILHQILSTVRFHKNAGMPFIDECQIIWWRWNRDMVTSAVNKEYCRNQSRTVLTLTVFIRNMKPSENAFPYYTTEIKEH